MHCYITVVLSIRFYSLPVQEIFRVCTTIQVPRQFPRMDNVASLNHGEAQLQEGMLKRLYSDERARGGKCFIAAILTMKIF